MSVEEIRKAVIGMDMKGALDAVKRTVSEGMSLEEADLEGIDGAIAEAGRKYESGKRRRGLCDKKPRGLCGQGQSRIENHGDRKRSVHAGRYC